MREADAGAVSEVDQPANLRLLVLHQRLVADAHHAAHVLVRKLVRVEHTYTHPHDLKLKI